MQSPIGCHVLAPGTWPLLSKAQREALAQSPLWLCDPRLDTSHCVACPPGAVLHQLPAQGPWPDPMFAAIRQAHFKGQRVAALCPSADALAHIQTTLRDQGWSSQTLQGPPAPTLAPARIVLTRAQTANLSLGAALLEKGHTSVSIPSTQYEDAPDRHALDAELARLRQYFGLIISSPRGAKVLAQSGANLDGCQLLAVGQATAQALARHGFSDAIIPEQAHSEGLVQCLKRHNWLDKSWLHLRGPKARAVLARAILAQSGQYHSLLAYQIRRPQLVAQLLTTLEPMLHQGAPPRISFASEQSYLRFRAQLEQHLPQGFAQRFLNRCEILSFGPVTSAALRQHGQRVHTQLPQPKRELQLAWLIRPDP